MGRLMRAVGRLLMAGIFVAGGWEAFRRPGARPRAAEKIGLPNPELAVRANGLGMALAGAAFGFGVRPKLSAAALIGMLVPTTVAGHRFWEQDDEAARRLQLTQFLKNAGLVAGLLFYLATPRPARADG